MFFFVSRDVFFCSRDVLFLQGMCFCSRDVFFVQGMFCVCVFFKGCFFFSIDVLSFFFHGMFCFCCFSRDVFCLFKGCFFSRDVLFQVFFFLLVQGMFFSPGVMIQSKDGLFQNPDCWREGTSGGSCFFLRDEPCLIACISVKQPRGRPYSVLWAPNRRNGLWDRAKDQKFWGPSRNSGLGLTLQVCSLAAGCWKTGGRGGPWEVEKEDFFMNKSQTPEQDSLYQFFSFFYFYEQEPDSRRLTSLASGRSQQVRCEMGS